MQLAAHLVDGPAQQRPKVVVSHGRVGHCAAVTEGVGAVLWDVEQLGGGVEGPAKGVGVGVGVDAAGDVDLLAASATVRPLLVLGAGGPDWRRRGKGGLRGVDSALGRGEEELRDADFILGRAERGD